jgi:26S proteasome regulatory subunit N10
MEATVICVDNSEWSRNGDYPPNRWESQQEAVNTIAAMKTNSNPGNSVGILAMAGSRVEVLVSPTNDIAKILAAIYNINIHGAIDFYSSLQIAQLALKHRPNKEQRQRIIVFVCSPIAHDNEKFAAVGRTLKRNNIALDIVCFGNLDEIDKLQELQKTVNSGDNSHFVSVPSGLGMLCDALKNTPIMHGGSAGYYDEFGGIDPTVDPEYATAIRLSLEEQKRRHEDEGSKQPEPVNPADDEEEKLLQEAIRLSMMEVDEKKEEVKQNNPETQDDVFKNQEFLTDLLTSMPGVDLQDPQIQETLNKLKSEEQKKDEEKKD